MPIDIKNPYEYVKSKIEALNNGKVSESDLGELRIFFTLFPQCLNSLNETGRSKLEGASKET